jgi:carbon storage regulator CsrA
MLVLSRKLNESIHIDGDIHVKVIAIQGKTVRLGFEAPASVGIYREEICLDLDPADLGIRTTAAGLREAGGVRRVSRRT